MKKCVLFLFAFAFTSLKAQVGINTTDPKAQLEIKATNQAAPDATDGILIPKVDAFPAINPTIDQDGMMVYLTTDVGANLKGFYYWDNTNSVWKSISGDKGWSLTGNAGTNATTNFIGTTDNVDLILKRNNIKSGLISYYNTSFGNNTLSSITPIGSVLGVENSAFGSNSLSSITSGRDNTAVGSSALSSLTNSQGNTAIGSRSLMSNTTGQANTALGNDSLRTNLINSFNTAVGYLTLYNSKADNNTAMGYTSMFENTLGQNNTAAGFESLKNNKEGINNVAIGSGALLSNISSNNVAVGKDALYNNTTGTFNSAVGKDALLSNTTGYRNSAFGFFSLYKNSTGIANSAFGSDSMYNNTTGYQNSAFGQQSLFSNTTGTYNSAFGENSLAQNTFGHENSAFGAYSLYSNTTGTKNVASGSYSLYSNLTGDNNLALGDRSLFNNTSGSANNAFGKYALYNNKGTGNCGYGEEANPTTTTGWNNIGIGFHSLGNISNGGRILGNQIGYDNIGLGLSAGDRTGYNINGCLFLGAFANVTFDDTDLTNATAIGRYATVNQNNTIVLGAINGINNAPASTRVGIGTYTPSCPLNVVGSSTQFGSWAFYARSGSSTTTGYAGGTSGNFSIIASDRIQATEFNAVSDARIKNIQSRMDSKNALEKINQLQVTNYTYKDWLQKGTAIKTGFIAQEVEKIIPSAVNQATNYIPNIMQVPHAFCVDTLKNTIAVNLEKPIHIKKGEKIRLYNKSTPLESEVILIDDYNFECPIPAHLQTDDLFVYGTQVSDFRSVDYDQIHTLSVAAIQELSKENEILKDKIRLLEQQNSSIEVHLQKLETAINNISLKSN